MFKRPHLIFLFCCTVVVVTFTFIRLLCMTPLLGFTLNCPWADTHTVNIGYFIGLRIPMNDCPGESAEKRVRLRLRLLVSTPVCHGLRPQSPEMFAEMRFAPSKVGWMPSLLIRPGFPQKAVQLFTKPTSFAGHHQDNQRWNDDLRLYMSSLIRLGRGPEKKNALLVPTVAE